MAESGTTSEQLLERLRMAEDALQRSERLAVASRYAGAVMHEINNPLEALINLVYVTKQAPHDGASVLQNRNLLSLNLHG